MKPILSIPAVVFSLAATLGLTHLLNLKKNPGLLISTEVAARDEPGIRRQLPGVDTRGILTVDTQRTIVLAGIVAQNAMYNAFQIEALTAISKRPIYVAINSPGGLVFTGAMMMDSMRKARKAGVNIRCVVVGESYSMGFNVLTECNEVYYTEKATFLFHPIRVHMEGVGLGKQLIQIGHEMDTMDKLLIGRISQYTGLDMEVLVKAYYEEKLWTGKELAVNSASRWLVPVRGVEGLPKAVFEWKGVGLTGRVGTLLRMKLGEADSAADIAGFSRLLKGMGE